MSNKFKGTGVALVTPFDDQLKIDFNGLDKVINHTLDEGVDYLVVQGTTGESVTVKESEKQDILKRVNELSQDKPVVLGIGGNDTDKVLSQIDSFSGGDFDAVLSVCPYYSKPSQAGLINHFIQIADKSPKPIILYNVPGRTSVNLSASATLTLAQHPNIIGIKEASGDFNQAIEIIKAAPADFLLISGDDLLTLPLISIGAVGVISVLANALTKKMCDIVNHALIHDYENARKPLYAISEINSLMYKEGNPTGIKCLLHIMGICNYNVRAPLAEASGELYKKIQESYARIK